MSLKFRGKSVFKIIATALQCEFLEWNFKTFLHSALVTTVMKLHFCFFLNFKSTFLFSSLFKFHIIFLHLSSKKRGLGCCIFFFEKAALC